MSASDSNRKVTSDGSSEAERILERISDAFYALDHEWRFTYVNAQAEQLVRRTRAELLGKCVWDEFPEAVGSGFDLQYRRAMAEQVPVTVEEFFPPLDTWFEVRAYPSPDGLSVFFQNVNARKQTEIHAMRFQQETDERFRSLYETMAQGVVYQGATGAILSANPAAERMLGLSMEEMTGRISADPRWVAKREDGSDFPAQDHPAMVALKTGQAVLGVTMGVFNPHCQEQRWLRVNAIPQFQHGENVPYQVYATFEDITEERRAENEVSQAVLELRAAHAKTTRILESITDAFFALDHDWRFVYLNDQAERLLLRSRSELFGKNVWSEFPAAVGTNFDLQYHRAMSEQTVVTFEEYYPLPLDRWFEVRAYPSPEGLSVYFHDVTDRKQTEEALQHSITHLRQVIDALPNIAWTTHGDGNLDYLNKQWRIYTGIANSTLNTTAWQEIIHPDDLTVVASAWTEAKATKSPWEVEYRLRRADGTYRWHLGRSEPVKDNAGRIKMWVGAATDIEEQKQAEKELRKSQEDLLFSVSSAQLGTFYCDWPLDKIIWNDTCKEHFFLPTDAVVDFALFYSLLHPADREPTRLAIERAMANRVEYNVEYRTLAPDGRTRWVNAVGRFQYNADGTPKRFDGITIDISARKANDEERDRRMERERFLADLAERQRKLSNPNEVIADAVHSVGQFLRVGRCVFGEIDLVADTCTIVADYCRDESLASIVGVFPFSEFGPYVVAEYQAGRAVSVEDVRLDPLRVTEANVALYESIGIRSHITAPVVLSSRLVSVIAVHHPVPRQWLPEEVEMLQDVVERTWLTVEVLRQQLILTGEAKEQRARAEREALLNRIGQALRRSSDPKVVLETAVRELGEALGADRCYYTAYHQSADTAIVGPEWRRDGLPSIEGNYVISRFDINSDTHFTSGNTQILTDTSNVSALRELGIAALVRVPLISGFSMTALAVAMSHEPREWTPEEVSLVETVATQTQTALEGARVQRREHNIAEQLQSALQPVLPEHIPGLEVGSFTRPALDEASVGGDFMDLFALDKELYALVIADVSGKGLAAAQQLALIRNSLRTTLYQHNSPAVATTTLNRIVTAHDLLIGFVTAWVGVYDSATGHFTYSSCGHEPALIRRANGVIESLVTSSPPLGVTDRAEYMDCAITLEPGDALLLYTDGISESGPSRRDLLGSDGLMRLLATLPADKSVQQQAEILVEKASSYSNGAFRDDVAVLLVRRQ